MAQHCITGELSCSRQYNRLARGYWDLVNNRLLIRMASMVHRMLYRASGGLLGATAGGPVLLLTTAGRKSGRSRTVPLLYLEDDANLVVVASNAGDDRHPAWWLNLEANHVATIRIKRKVIRVCAREATEVERTRLWPRFVRMYSGYENYRCRTRRRIPIVILNPK